MKKIFFMSMVIVFVLCLPLSQVWGNDKVYVPEKIKIGLKFEDSATSIAHLHSDSGFEIGWYDNNTYYVLYNLMNNKDLIIRKDSYFIELGNSYVEVNDNHGGDVHGPYHVQIGKVFSTKEAMENEIEELKKILDVYPVYENGWKIYSGLFISEEEAYQYIQAYGKINGEELQIVYPSNNRIQILDTNGNVLFMYKDDGEDYYYRAFLEKDSHGIINFDGKNFRGEFLIKRNDDRGLTVINYLSLQEYLYGVLPREMSGDWPLEALKAQAVAARNYAVANMGKHSDYGFDLCSTIDCQVYGGYDVESPRSNMAVDETIGKVLTYEGEVISAFFHSNSGGSTEDSENVWGMAIPYIRGVKDDFSLEAPNSSWTKIYTKDDIENILISNGIDVGDIINVYPKEYSNNGRVIELSIVGTEGEKVLLREKPRAIFGYNELKSMNFEIETDAKIFVKSSENSTKLSINGVNIMSSNGNTKAKLNRFNVYNGVSNKSITLTSDKFIFNGKGWGHGLGMSQWGAKKMAELGYSYEDILKYYYTGTKLE